MCMGTSFWKEHCLTKLLHSSASNQNKSKGREGPEPCDQQWILRSPTHRLTLMCQEELPCGVSESRLCLLSLSWTLTKRTSGYLAEHFYTSFILPFSLLFIFFCILQEQFFARFILDCWAIKHAIAVLSQARCNVMQATLHPGSACTVWGTNIRYL